jgi:tetratricopeptide (TPR) repeat protein
MSMALNGQQPQEQQPPTEIRQRAGDRAIQIGQVFGNVVFQLLSTRAVIVILAAVAIAAVVSLHLYRMAQKPGQMTGDFNVAVAQFGEVTDEGTVSSALATQISKLLFDFLDSEYKATDFGLDIQVAQKKIGILTENREAEQLAYDIGADIVIYGGVFVIGDEATLSPKFYVADQPDTGELTGQHQLAVPIQFDISSLSLQDKVNTELQSRAAILVHFTEGLVYLSASNLDAASHSFQEAIREAERREPFGGQEVLYLFAAVANRLQRDFEEAAKNLGQALFLNPEYARAYIARGNVYYDQGVTSWDQTKLDQALSEYERALEAEDQPAGAYIREKLNVSMGNIYVIRAQETKDPNLFAQAISHYDQVVGAYEETKNERIRGLAATAYFGLGTAYERWNDYAEAAEAYQRCIEIASDSELKARAEKQFDTVNNRGSTDLSN